MEKYVLGILAPMVLSGVLFVLAGQLPGWLSAVSPDCPGRKTLPAASGAYVFTALVAGALAEAGCFLLNREDPFERVFTLALFWLGYLSFLHWMGRSADASKRADQKRTSLVLFVPFVSAIWITAGILLLTLR